MKTIFFKVFFTFITAFILLIFIMTMILLTGFNTSIKKWEIEQVKILEKDVYTILSTLPDINKFSIEYISQQLMPIIKGNFIIKLYNNKKKLLFIFKKGRRGMHLPENQIESYTTKLKEIKLQNNQTFFFSMSLLNFKDDHTNKEFLNSVRVTLIVSLISSLFIAIIFAFVFSKSLSKESKNVLNGINQIAKDNLNIDIKEKGTFEIAQIAKAANTLRQKLKKEKELRNQWAEDISHDLRTPVAALKAQMEGIKDGILNFNIKRINKNLTEIEKLELLINDLSELIKVESPEIKIKPEKFGINPFIKEILSSLSTAIDKKNINIKLDLLIDTLYADKKLFYRALSNIINNAVKYTKNKGSVQISTLKNESNNTIIKIFNSDSYISKKEQDKIFDRLYRGEFARNTQGTGLGLTIAKSIIELHKGQIKIESQENNGTTFTIILN